MGVKPSTFGPFIKGVDSSTGVLTQPKGSIPRGSNLLLSKRGSLRTCDGSGMVNAYNGVPTAGRGRDMCDFFFAPTGVAGYYLRLMKALDQHLGAPKNLAASLTTSGTLTVAQAYYWVYGGQQESGSAAVSSRGNDGQITFREWHPVGAEEYDYIAPDPLNPNIIYGSHGTKFNRVTGVVEQVSPRGNYRYLRTAPLVFSYVDPHLLYLGAQVVLKTADGGKNWEAISPDLTREAYEIPASVASYGDATKEQATRRGVVYAIGPSHLNV